MYISTSTTFEIHSAHERPDCWDALLDAKHPLNKAWPRFLDHDLSQQHFYDKILDYSWLRRFQFAIIERDPAGEEALVACGRSIPFFWPELDEASDTDTLSASPRILQSLPNGGWDTMVARGLRQFLVRERLPSSALPTLTPDQDSDMGTCQLTNKPNALSALAVTVREDRRNMGLAERLIGAMKQVARNELFRILVVPLRPTRKSEFQLVHMDNYLGCTLSQAPLRARPTSFLKNAAHSPPYSALAQLSERERELPFDPWVRKHVRLGGTLAKIAPSSMVVSGTFVEWQDWTGIDFYRLLRNIQALHLMTEAVTKMGFVEIPIPGGLVPLKVHLKEERCTYTEPNVWVYHQIQRE
ncbi:MAG: hypothetical protein Q9181_006293 [Wetmoreana brouardii]